MNKIFNQILKARNGHYCHVVEVSSPYELEAIVESVYDEFIDQYAIDDIKEFFNTLQVYFLDDESLTDEQNKELENEVYNFSFNAFIDQLN